MKIKHCGGCEQTKPTTDFATNRRAKDGRQWHCRQCMNEYSKVRKRGIKEGWWNK